MATKPTPKPQSAMSKFFKLRTRPDVAAGASIEDVVELGKLLGIEVAIDADGKPIAVPPNLDLRRNGDSNDIWGSNPAEVNRADKLRTYNQMDDAGSEPAVVLDTFADEVVLVVDNTEQALFIEISDKEIREKVLKVLVKHRILNNVRSDVRQLCKHGDFAYLIRAGTSAELVQVPLTDAKVGAKTSTPLRPEDIKISFAPSTSYELEADDDAIYKLKYNKENEDVHSLHAASGDKEIFEPWEFSLFSIKNRGSFPYGTSVLEKMRNAWDRLNIMDRLLASSRAGAVDRIAISVPGLGSDIGSIMSKLTQLKNSIKTILSVSSTSKITRNQESNGTEWLWLPEAFKASKLSTAVELAKPDDVEYFRENIYNASRLPKGFFNVSESGNIRPMSLRQQDIKFARSLVPVSEAYCDGIKHLVTLLAFYMGGDLSTLKISVSLKKSAYLSSEMMDSYKNFMSLIDSYIEIRKKIDENYKISADDVKRMIDIVDGPYDIIFPEDGKETGNSDQSSALFETLMAKPRQTLYEVGIGQFL